MNHSVAVEPEAAGPRGAEAPPHTNKWLMASYPPAPAQRGRPEREQIPLSVSAILKCSL